MEENEVQTTPEVTEAEKENLEPNQPEGETPAQEEEEVNQTQEPIGEEPIDYKTKFSESTRENQILQSKVKQYESRRELTNQPTETELKAAFPSWDFMTETEKELAKSNLVTQKMAKIALSAQQKREDDEKWNNQLEFAITSNPDLQGKEREFKEFASKPSHRGAPIEVLADAFLHKSGTVVKPKTMPQPVLQPGSGGPKESVTPHKYTTEEMSTIRKTDYKRWLEIVKSGQYEEV